MASNKGRRCIGAAGGHAHQLKPIAYVKSPIQKSPVLGKEPNKKDAHIHSKELYIHSKKPNVHLIQRVIMEQNDGYRLGSEYMRLADIR